MGDGCRGTVRAAALAWALAWGAAPAVAQERPFAGAVAAYLGGGVAGPATDRLGDALEDGGLPGLGGPAGAIGLGGYVILPGRLMLGAEWNGLVMGEEEHAGGELGLGGGYGTLGVGYAIELTPGARVYPRIGVGGGGLGLWIDHDGGALAFDEALVRLGSQDASDPEVSLGRDGPVLDLGGGVELLPGGWARGLLIGMRVGWLAASFDSSWQLDGRPVTGGPDATLSGPYARIVLGGGLGW